MPITDVQSIVLLQYGGGRKEDVKGVNKHGNDRRHSDFVFDCVLCSTDFFVGNSGLRLEVQQEIVVTRGGLRVKMLTSIRTGLPI